MKKKKKTVEDHGKKQVSALENLKPKEQTKPIEDKSNNQSKAKIIFDDLINKRKKRVCESYGSVEQNNLKFEYIGQTKDARFYEYKDSKERLNAIKSNQIKFS